MPQAAHMLDCHERHVENSRSKQVIKTVALERVLERCLCVAV